MFNIQCSCCGRDFSSYPSEMRKNRSGKRYCSRDCYKKNVKQDASRGEARHNYVKDIPPFLIEDEMVAYFLGFLQSDGTIQSKYVCIEISDIDQDVLYSFQKKFGGTVSFRIRDTNFKKDCRLAQWRIGSVLFVRQMNALGFPCGKKAKRTKPIGMPPDLERHYVRGLIDGDGSLSFSAAGKPFLGFTTASEEMKEYFRKWLARLDIKTDPARNQRDKIFNFCLSGQRAVDVSRSLYDGASVFLARKKNTADQFAVWKPNTCERKTWTRAEVHLLHDFDFDVQKIIDSGKITGRSNGSISVRCSAEKKRVKNVRAILHDWE